MSIIEEIKRDVRHDETCIVSLADWANREGISDYQSHNPDVHCNCSRRRKIAWLERLEKPTAKMVTIVHLNQRRSEGFWSTYDELLKAAEEDLP